jgi:hypothetical protein
MVMIVIQKVLTDFQMMTFVFFCKLFWNTSYTDVTKAKVVTDDFMGRTMTDMQMGCYLISGRMSSGQNHVTCTFNIVSSRGCGWAA